MERIEIGVSRAYMLDLLSAARAEFEKPDTAPIGTVEFSFEARDNDSGDRLVVRFANDDMERDDITDQVYVDVT